MKFNCIKLEYIKIGTFSPVLVKIERIHCKSKGDRYIESDIIQSCCTHGWKSVTLANESIFADNFEKKIHANLDNLLVEIRKTRFTQSGDVLWNVI